MSDGKSEKSLRNIAIFGIYALLVLAWIYAIPGFVAYESHVMSEADISARLPLDVRSEWNEYQCARASYKRCADLATSEIANAANSADNLGSLVNKQQACSAALRELKPPATLAPYSGNWLSEIWVIAYVGLGVLLLTHSFGKIQSINVGRAFLVLLGLYAAFDWDNYVRNFVLSGVSEGRRVFSFVNWDISHPSFVLQELRSLAMMLLIALLWEHYFHSANVVDDEIKTATGTDSAELVQQVLLYRTTLLRWQTDSVLLAVVFVPFDYFSGRK